MRRIAAFALFGLVLLVGCGETELTTDTGTATPTATSFSAKITKGQEIPAPTVTTNPTGTGTFSLNAAKTELTFQITVTGLSGAITSAHIHNAPAGLTGIAVKTLTSSFSNNTASGTWKSTDNEPLISDLVTALEAGQLYLNIHTAANPAGEIRGQIIPIPSGSKGFTARITGNQEVPPVSTTATGTGSFALNAAKTELAFEITATNLVGNVTGGIYNAAEGANGGIVLALSFTDDTASGVWKTDSTTTLTPARVVELEAGRLYVNIQTTAKPNGEIRGQILADP